jgi:undecaprenyl diphosphate synthase
MSEKRKLPAHIAIVMDGNGRWAENRNRPRTLGHQAGLKALRRIVEHCGRRGIPELTIFAFSSENWNRPPNEVNRLMDLFMKALDKETRELHENGVKLNFIGDLSAFSAEMQQRIVSAMQQTRENQRMLLNVAVNYGGRWDITQAARSLAESCARGELNPAEINENTLAEKLMLNGSSDPDLFIRTGGEMRISNFLLWQSAYTEFHFTPILWPDFSPKALDAALEDYQGRERRFGRTGKQIRRQAS